MFFLSIASKQKVSFTGKWFPKLLAESYVYHCNVNGIHDNVCGNHELKRNVYCEQDFSDEFYSRFSKNLKRFLKCCVKLYNLKENNALASMSIMKINCFCCSRCRAKVSEYYFNVRYLDVKRFFPLANWNRSIFFLFFVFFL